MAMRTKAGIQQQLTSNIMQKDGKRGVIVGGGRITSQRVARRVMGKNFFGIEEGVKHFAVRPTETERLSVIEWGEELLDAPHQHAVSGGRSHREQPAGALG